MPPPTAPAEVLTLPDNDGLSPDLFPGAPAAGFFRQSGRLKFLLALDETGNLGLGEVELVHDADFFLRRLHCPVVNSPR